MLISNSDLGGGVLSQNLEAPNWEVPVVPESNVDFFFGKLRAFSTWFSSTESV